MRVPVESRRSRRRNLQIAGDRLLNFEPLEDRCLLAAGVLDPSFGVGGKVTTDFFHNPSSTEEAYATAITLEGKIVAVGSGGFIAQYNANGSLDTAFGEQGLAAFAGVAQAVAVQSDGKIVVAGWTSDGFSYDFAVARYNADGTPDTSFAGDGRLTSDITNIARDDFAYGVAVQSDGKILVAGHSTNLGAG